MSVNIKTRVGAKGKRWLVYYRLGGRDHVEQYGGSFRTAKEARARRDLIAGELAAARDPRLLLEELRAPRVRPSGLLKVWDDFMASRIDVGASTRSLYRSGRDRIVPVLGADKLPAEITPADIQDAIAQLADLAPASVRQYVSTLGQVLDYADVSPNPVRSRKVRFPSRDAAEVVPPSTQDWLAVRAMLKPRYLLLADLVEACGLRIGEALALTYGDVDFAGGRLRVSRARTKTRSGQRWLPVPAPILDALDALVPLEDRYAARRVFTTDYHTFRADLDRACKLAGVPYFSPHDLRHRRISLWFAHGVDVVQIRVWAGHAKASMSSDTYGHVLIDASADRWREFWASERASGSSGAAYVRHSEGSE